MITIHKYQLPVQIDRGVLRADPRVVLQLPRGFEVLSVGAQLHEKPSAFLTMAPPALYTTAELWARVDTEQPLVDAGFYLALTGNVMPADSNLLGRCLGRIDFGHFVIHVFADGRREEP